MLDLFKSIVSCAQNQQQPVTLTFIFRNRTILSEFWIEPLEKYLCIFQGRVTPERGQKSL